jgi:hypothetical protein
MIDINKLKVGDIIYQNDLGESGLPYKDKITKVVNGRHIYIETQEVKIKDGQEYLDKKHNTFYRNNFSDHFYTIMEAWASIAIKGNFELPMAEE